jgi:ribosomal-protein-serine acetyltransferase
VHCKKATLPIYSTNVKIANVHGATLKTELLRISPSVKVIPAAIADASALASLVQENAVFLKKYLPKVATLSSVAACAKHLQHVLDAGKEDELFEWHIFANDTLCGAIRLNKIDLENQKASMGYYIAENCQGQGLASSSVRAVLGHCFDKLGLNRIELQCTSTNLASQQVAKRLGFTWEGMLRQAELLDGEYVDLFVYGLLREDFHLQAANARDDKAD